MDKQEQPRITEEEIAIIKKAKAGDESAFTWIFNRYQHLVESILYGYIGDQDEARDITNVVFLKVHEKLSKFTTYDSFGGWLRTLTKRTAVDYLRRMNKKRLTLGDDDERLSSSEYIGYAEDEVVDRLTTSRVLDLLDKLNPTIRQVFEMFYLDNMTVEKISESLHIPTGTIKSYLARTRRKLQKQFNVKQQ